jgi:hypothetical protein
MINDGVATRKMIFVFCTFESLLPIRFFFLLFSLSLSLSLSLLFFYTTGNPHVIASEILTCRLAGWRKG